MLTLNSALCSFKGMAGGVEESNKRKQTGVASLLNAILNVNMIKCKA